MEPSVKTEDFNLHDGLIKSLHVDFDKGAMVIELLYYKSQDDKIRSKLKLKFNDIKSVCSMFNLEQISKMTGYGGNINDWNHVDESDTCIDLSGGYIIVKSGSLKSD